jgi:hypothetical protein
MVNRPSSIVLDRNTRPDALMRSSSPALAAS